MIELSQISDLISKKDDLTITIPDSTRKNVFYQQKTNSDFGGWGQSLSGNLSNDSPGVSIAILPQVQSRGFFLFGS